MAWDGIEKRSETRFCEGHLSLVETLIRIEERQIAQGNVITALDKRVNGSIGTIEKHMDNSVRRNLTIGIALITILIFIYNLAVASGENRKQVQINSERWNRVIENGGFN